VVPARLFEEAARLDGRAADGSDVEVPLVHTDVEMDVRGLVASTTVTQQYVNRAGVPLETVYTFPLPPAAAVFDLEIRMGDRVIRSTVQEREQAQRTYDQARENGQRAALLTQDRPNVFTTAIANVMPGDALDVRIRYVEKLAWDHGNIRVIFPTVVSPRYLPPPQVETVSSEMTDPSNLASHFAPVGRAAGHDLSLRARLDLGATVTQLSSPTHALSWKVEPQGVTVLELEDRFVLPDRDVVLDIQVPRGNLPATSLFLSPDPAGSDAAFMLVAYPPEESAAHKRAPMEWLFIVDTSGSMEGPSITQARQAVLQAFTRMRSTDRFNVVAYSDTHHAFRPEPVEASSANVREAGEYVEGLRAGGGTLMLPALNKVMAMPRNPEALRYIVLLTDGELGNEEEIFTAMRSRLGEARLFVVTVGSAPNHFLATKMAQFGRGTVANISDGTEIAAQMNALLDKIESPVLSGVTLAWDGVQAMDVLPQRVPDLFMGMPLVVMGRVSGKHGTLALDAMRGARPVHWALDVDVSKATFHPGITTLWARQKVETLMDVWRDARTDEERLARRLSVVHHAVAYNLVTAFTSLVAVEEKVVNEGGAMKAVRVPVEVPHGMNRANVEQANPHGGTADDFLLALAWLLLLVGGVLVVWSPRRRVLA
jgi:Ca-activated chloride channel family protein